MRTIGGASECPVSGRVPEFQIQTIQRPVGRVEAVKAFSTVPRQPWEERLACLNTPLVPEFLRQV